MNEQAIDIVIKAKDEATKAVQKVTKNLSGMKDALTKVWQVSAVAFWALMVAVNAGKNAIDEDAEATNRLTKLLKTASKATDEQVASLIAQAEALEKSTVAWYDMIATTQSQLATFNLQASTIEKLTPAILDYVIAEKWANASAEEFRQMTNGLAQALNGNFASLTRSGFVLDEHTKKLIKNGTEAQKAEAITKVLSGTYKGFAEDATQTAIGKQIMLNKALEDVNKLVASAIIPIIDELKLKVLVMAQAVLKWTEQHPELTKNLILWAVAVAWLGSALLVILPVLSAVWTAITTWIVVIKALWTALMFLATNQIGLIITAIAWLGIAMYMVWKNWDTVKTNLILVWAQIKRDVSSIVDGLVTWLVTTWDSMAKTAKEWAWNMVQMFIDGLKEKVQALKDWLVQIATTIQDYLWFHSPTKKGPGSEAHKWMPNLINMLAIGLQEWKGKIDAKAKEIASTLKAMWSSFKFSDIANTLVSIWDKAKESFANVTNNIQSSIDKIKGLKSELEGINSQIQTLSTQRKGTETEWKQALAERTIEIEKQIATIKADAEAMATAEGKEKLKKLQEELDFANVFLTTQEKAFALQQMNRSESQVILDNMWKKMGELDIEIMKQQQLAKEKKQAIKDEQILQKDLTDARIALDNQYYKLFNEHIEWAKSSIRETIALMSQLNSMGGGAFLSGTRATGWSVKAWEPYLVWERGPEIVIPKSASTVMPNNKVGAWVSVAINFWNVSVRNDWDIQEIARTIENSLIRKLQIYKQGIS